MPPEGVVIDHVTLTDGPWKTCLKGHQVNGRKQRSRSPRLAVVVPEKEGDTVDVGRAGASLLEVSFSGPLGLG